MTRAGAVPVALFEEWAQVLSARFTNARSVLVANRAEQLLVRTVGSVPAEVHRAALHEAVAAVGAVIPLEQLRLLFFRLEACIGEVTHTAPTEDLALIVVVANVFLQYTSPVRRLFVETYLYPALCNQNLQPLLADPSARLHLCDLLLQLIGPSTSNRCPFYLCLCALLQNFLTEATSGAQVLTTLVARSMPHAAHFTATLAADRNMDAECFTNIVLAMSRGLAMSLGQLEHLAEDPVGCMIDNNAGLAYRMIATLRAVVRKIATLPNGNARGSRMLVGLRTALPARSIAVIGQFAEQAFTVANEADADPATPTLLVAEIGTVLHGTNLESALTSLRDFFGESMEVCPFCRKTRASEALCHANGAEHLANAQAKQRMARTVAEECGGSEAVSTLACELLRQAPLSPATHRTVFELLRQAGNHQTHMLQAIDQALTFAVEELHGLLSRPDSPCFTDPVVAAQSTSGLVFATRIVSALSCTYSTSAPVSEGVLHKVQLLIRTLLRVFSEDNRRAMAERGSDSGLVHHIAMSVWWCCGWLLRRCHTRCVQLKPTAAAANAGSFDSTKHDVVAAANALAILSALNSVHHVSWYTEKMVGLAVSRLVVDFNLQICNIAEHLLAPHGIQLPDRSTTARFALPTKPCSDLWSFAKHQLRRSGPFRVAFASTIAQCSALRFRGFAASGDPTAALKANGAESEPTAPILFTCVVEAMRQDASLARSVIETLVDGLRGVEPASRKTKGSRAVNTELAASPSRRLMFAHTLQQIVANLRAVSTSNEDRGLHSGLSPLAVNVRSVVEAAGHALVSEAVALQALAAKFCTSSNSPLAKLLTRVSDQCAVGVPKNHAIPAAPPDFNEFDPLPPADFNDGYPDDASNVAKSSARGRAVSAGDESLSAVAGVMGQIIDTTTFDRIIGMSQLPSTSIHGDSQSGSANGKFSAFEAASGEDGDGFEEVDADIDRPNLQADVFPPVPVGCSPPAERSRTSDDASGSLISGHLPSAKVVPADRVARCATAHIAVQADLNSEDGSMPQRGLAPPPSVVAALGRPVEAATQSAAASATFDGDEMKTNQDNPTGEDDAHVRKVLEWVSRQRTESVMQELRFLRDEREEEELVASNFTLHHRAVANNDFDRFNDATRPRQSAIDSVVLNSLPADQPVEVATHGQASSVSLWRQHQPTSRVTMHRTTGLPRESTAPSSRAFGKSLPGNSMKSVVSPDSAHTHTY